MTSALLGMTSPSFQAQVAGADAMQSADVAGGMLERRMRSLGLNPASPRYQGTMRKWARDRAALTSNAKTMARAVGRKESFDRLMALLRLRGGGGGRPDWQYARRYPFPLSSTVGRAQAPVAGGGGGMAGLNAKLAALGEAPLAGGEPGAFNTAMRSFATNRLEDRDFPRTPQELRARNAAIWANRRATMPIGAGPEEVVPRYEKLEEPDQFLAEQLGEGLPHEVAPPPMPVAAAPRRSLAAAPARPPRDWTAHWNNAEADGPQRDWTAWWNEEQPEEGLPYQAQI